MSDDFSDYRWGDNLFRGRKWKIESVDLKLYGILMKYIMIGLSY